MKIEYRRILKCIWVLLSVAVIMFSLDSCVESQYGCYAERENMLLSMLLLSFPSSLLVFLLLVALLSPATGFYEMPTSLFLLGFFAAGYVQWFWVVPHLLEKDEMITLGIVQDRATPVERKRQRASRTRKRKERRRAARLQEKRVVHFDELGRTPLERIIDESRA